MKFILFCQTTGIFLMHRSLNLDKETIFIEIQDTWHDKICWGIIFRLPAIPESGISVF